MICWGPEAYVGVRDETPVNWGLEGLGCKLLSGGVTVFGLKFTVFLVTGVFLSIPGVACSNFAPVEGPKIVTVFGLKTVIFITVFTGILYSVFL